VLLVTADRFCRRSRLRAITAHCAAKRMREWAFRS
jgi:hypothetical protein